MLIRRVWRFVLAVVPVIIASPVLVLAIQGGMFLPVGIFVAIYSPWSPFVLFPQTRWLVTHTIWMPRDVRAQLTDAGWAVLAAGLLIFIASYVYFYTRADRRTLVTTGPYAVIRHPQYLGILLGLTGITLLGARPIAVVAWVTAICTYLALMIYEEGENERRFGQTYRAYQARVPFLIPLFPPSVTRRLARAVALPRAAQYLAIIALYIALVAVAIAMLRDRSFPT